jgi:pilus assembly protein Flp/PilA
MSSKLNMLVFRLKGLLADEQGQDLVEYALVLALIAFGCTASMQALAGGINTAFDTISTTLAVNI